jgi:Skp family chaperone for outer membrane proteins
MRKYFISAFFVFMTLAVVCAQEVPAVFEAENQTAAQPESEDKLPLGARDTAVIVPVGDADDSALPQQETPPQQENLKQTDETSAETLPKTEEQPSLKKGFAIGGTQKDLLEKLPEGTLAVYIDIEEAFNKNPWTLQARLNMRLDLEAKQIEYANMQQQLKELKLKEKNLNEEIAYYKPYYEPLEYINPPLENIYPKLKTDETWNILNTIIFSSSAAHIASPENSPQKLEQLKEALKDTKKSILENETFLLNYKELSKEEILSRQDYIVQEVLKEIYSGIKEYAQVRNIGLIVDKKNLIYGKPLNVTNEFVKWMKNYHKKYVKEHGDIL